MTFLVLPRTRTPSDRLLAVLKQRLCPYTEIPREVLRTEHFSVWGTSLTKSEAGCSRNALESGTAGFVLRVEGEGLTIAADPLGTCPIWYARSGDDWLVTPEVKALATLQEVEFKSEAELLATGPRPADWSPYRNVLRLSPGCELGLSEGRAVPAGHAPRFELEGPSETLDVDWARLLGKTLISSFAPSAASTGSFISGGIDSSIACSLARRQGPVASFSLGTAYGDEFEQAQAVAEYLGCTHQDVHLASSEVEDELDRVVFQNEVFDGLTAEVLLQLSALYRTARGSCERITTGYGSDLLFDGMLRHAAYMHAIGLESTTELIERTRWTGELAPFVHWSLGISAEHVFWKRALIDLALRIPRSQCFEHGIEKNVLRESAVLSGLLPRQLAFREKTGLSDGTGANRLVSEVLGLGDKYGYGEKTKACIRRLKKLLPAREL